MGGGILLLLQLLDVLCPKTYQVAVDLVEVGDDVLNLLRSRLEPFSQLSNISLTLLQTLLLSFLDQFLSVFHSLALSVFLSFLNLVNCFLDNELLLTQQIKVVGNLLLLLLI